MGSHSTHQTPTLEAYNLKVKSYFKVFWILLFLTVFEVAIVFAPFPKIVTTLIIVVASLAKAFFVGWYYMHLNHESRGLRWMMYTPIAIVFVYAVVLIGLASQERASPYENPPARFLGPRNLQDAQRDTFGNLLSEEKRITPTDYKKNNSKHSSEDAHH